MWIMQSGHGRVDHGLSEKYSGQWVLAEGLPFIEGLEDLIAQENPCLFNIPGNVLRETYFPREILSRIKEHASMRGQTGELVFKAKPLPHQSN